MAAAFVQSRRETGNLFVASTSAGVTLAAPTTPGNTLVAVLNMREGENVNNVTDDGGNVYTLADSHFHSGDAVRSWVYVCVQAPNAANTLTFTISATFDNAAGISFIEFSGLGELGAVSSGEADGPGPTVPDSGSITVQTAGGLAIGAVASSGVTEWTMDADFTAITTNVGGNGNGSVGYRIASGTYNFTPSTPDSGTAVSIIVALEEPPLQVNWNLRQRHVRPRPFAPGRIR